MSNRCFALLVALVTSACTLAEEGADELPDAGIVIEHLAPKTPERPPRNGCDLVVDNPHESGHNPGNVNVVARTRCDYPTKEIRLTIYLDKRGRNVATETFVRTGRAFVKESVHVTCQDDKYRGRAKAVIVHALDHNPATETLERIGYEVDIKCSFATLR